MIYMKIAHNLFNTFIDELKITVVCAKIPNRSSHSLLQQTRFFEIINVWDRSIRKIEILYRFARRFTSAREFNNGASVERWYFVDEEYRWIFHRSEKKERKKETERKREKRRKGDRLFFSK